jgi:phosphatidylglycerol:prolipoprotein diacylglycerol transferase
VRQTLFYIPRELFGWPLFGWGILLAVWAVAVAVFLAARMWRRGLDADTRSYLPVLLVLGAAIAFVIPAIMAPRGLPIRGYGAMLVLAIVAACALAIYRVRRAGICPDVVVSLAFWSFLGGILGARLFYVVEYWDDFAGQPSGQTALAILNLTQGGLVIYGAIIGGILCGVAFLVTQRLPVLAVGDLLAPAIALGLGLGRLGCFLNGCCFGGACDFPWAVRFPAPSPPFQRQVERGEIFLHGLKLTASESGKPVIESVEPGSAAAAQGLRSGDTIETVNNLQVASVDQAIELLLACEPGTRLRLAIAGKGTVGWTLPRAAEKSRPIHPTQLYSTIDGVVLCLFLLAVHPFRRRDGATLAWLLTLYPLSRFLIEIVRIDEPGVFGTGLSIAQVLSIAFLMCAAALWAHVLRQPKGTVLPEQPLVSPA